MLLESLFIFLKTTLPSLGRMGMDRNQKVKTI